MSKVKKIIKKMHENPRDWRISDLETVARHYNVNVRKNGGSHVVFDHPSWVGLHTVPAHRPIKPVYVEKFISLILTLENSDE